MKQKDTSVPFNKALNYELRGEKKRKRRNNSPHLCPVVSAAAAAQCDFCRDDRGSSKL